MAKFEATVCLRVVVPFDVEEDDHVKAATKLEAEGAPRTRTQEQAVERHRRAAAKHAEKAVSEFKVPGAKVVEASVEEVRSL